MSRLVIVPLVATLALLLSGCGDEEGSPPADAASSSPSASEPRSDPSDEPSADTTETPAEDSSEDAADQVIEITVAGSTVDPADERIQVKAGEPVTLTINSDRDGEIHLHSAPEQTIDFGPGTTTKRITIKVPGLVEMEEHESDVLIATLEVR